MIWISLLYATFGIISKGNIIVDAPPIAKWTIGKQKQFVIKYYDSKKAKIIQLND